MFDRILIAEALAVLAWDYGLYGVWNRLREDWQFKPRPSLRNYGDLEERGRLIYDLLEPRAKVTGPWDKRLRRV